MVFFVAWFLGLGSSMPISLRPTRPFFARLAVKSFAFPVGDDLVFPPTTHPLCPLERSEALAERSRKTPSLPAKPAASRRIRAESISLSKGIEKNTQSVRRRRFSLRSLRLEALCRSLNTNYRRLRFLVRFKAFCWSFIDFRIAFCCCFAYCLPALFCFLAALRAARDCCLYEG